MITISYIVRILSFFQEKPRMVGADHLVKRTFSGKSVKALLGQRDLTMDEAARIIGRKIGKPDLKYVTFSYDDAYGDCWTRACPGM
jgi:hypothetical protein